MFEWVLNTPYFHEEYRTSGILTCFRKCLIKFYILRQLKGNQKGKDCKFNAIFNVLLWNGFRHVYM